MALRDLRYQSGFRTEPGLYRYVMKDGNDVPVNTKADVRDAWKALQAARTELDAVVVFSVPSNESGGPARPPVEDGKPTGSFFDWLVITSEPKK